MTHGRRNVYHPGELAVQELAGERELAERHAAGIGASIMLPARPFLARQQLLALATAAPDGEVWAAVWFGRRGFVDSSEQGESLFIDRRQMAALELDPVGELLREGTALGVLAIELESRRRLRVNGKVRSFGPEAVALEVRECFANCPKYIAKRFLQPVGAGEDSRSGAATAASSAHGTRLDPERRATISRTDTMFVGSLHPERGADASHRGGDPGFVQVLDEQTLRIPDYSGNGMYQTLGNLHATGRAGLVFLDFTGRRLLHVTGTTSLDFAGSAPALVTGGTGRSWDLHIERWREGALPADVQGELLERSRFIPRS